MSAPEPKNVVRIYDEQAKRADDATTELVSELLLRSRDAKGKIKAKKEPGLVRRTLNVAVPMLVAACAVRWTQVEPGVDAFLAKLLPWSSQFLDWLNTNVWPWVVAGWAWLVSGDYKSGKL